MEKAEEYAARGLLKPELKKLIYSKYADKCYVCDYTIKAALRVHHIIPREFGGKDDIDNFVLLCSNCHTLTHYYSSQRYQNKEIKNVLKAQLKEDAIKRLEGLILKVQNARRAIAENGNVWTAREPYTIDKAIEVISRKNKFEQSQRNQLSQVIGIVLHKIPTEIRGKCSYRLLKEGKYLSINLMNYLLFRTPAYGDFAESPKFDCYLTFPKEKIPDELKPIEKRDVFLFEHFDCVNIGLSYDETLDLDSTDWSFFQNACRMAQIARRSREWISNVTLSSNYRP